VLISFLIDLLFFKIPDPKLVGVVIGLVLNFATENDLICPRL